MSTNANFGQVPTTQKISNMDFVPNVYCIPTTLCGQTVLCLMCCLGGCEGQWEAVCEQHITYSPVTCGEVDKSMGAMPLT
jgi:hypothetical protein